MGDTDGSGELDVLARIEALLPRPPAGETWIGDDAAVLVQPPGALLVTTDLVVDGVHVDLRLASAADVGWKAVATAVSDIAAMGGIADRVVVGVASPPGVDLDALAGGVAAAAAASGVDVVGGDLSAGPALTVAVTVTGHVDHAPPPVLRSGARPGAPVHDPGPLGASSAGLRLLRQHQRGSEGPRGPEGATTAALVRAHLRPAARLAEGACARLAGASAMIDVSDGLATDLRHIAVASGVVVRLDTVPVADGCTHDDALSGGEDYELIVTTTSPDTLVAAFVAAGLRPPVVIGACLDPVNAGAAAGEVLWQGAPLAARGFEHRFG